jgi:hypothetical protein
VERQGNMINVLNRAREYKEGIITNAEGNNTVKDDKGNSSRYGNRNYCNIMNNTSKVIFHSQKTTSNNDVVNVTSSTTTNNNNSNNNNNNTPFVTQQRNNTINHNPSFISRKTFRSTTPPPIPSNKMHSHKHLHQTLNQP